MKLFRRMVGLGAAAVVSVVLLSHPGGAQNAAPARKRLLVIGDEKGYRHEAVTRDGDGRAPRARQRLVGHGDPHGSRTAST